MANPNWETSGLSEYRPAASFVRHSGASLPPARPSTVTLYESPIARGRILAEPILSQLFPCRPEFGKTEIANRSHFPRLNPSNETPDFCEFRNFTF